VKEWEKLKYEIIIGVDMNESISHKSSKVKKIIDNTSLIPIVETEDAPETYARGRKCIDFILGTPKIKRATIAQGYLPFYKGGWESDHRGLFADLQLNELFETAKQMKDTPKRNLTSTNWIQASKFMKNLSRCGKLKEIETELIKLEKNEILSDKQHTTLDKLDKLFTKTLTNAEGQCCGKKEEYWSDTLFHAKIILKY
jgi:hypothetical protein